MSAQIQIATVDRTPIHFLQAGEPGATHVLLLVHAFPVGPRLFEPQLGAFPGWRVIAPAMPGFDGSRLMARPSIDAYGRLMCGLLDALAIPSAVVGGVSMGGHCAFAMLRHVPERITALVLADTRSEGDSQQALEGRRRLLQVAKEQGPAAIAAEMVPKLLGTTTQHQRPDVVEHVRARIESQSGEAIAAAIDVLMSRPDSTPMLADIRVPSLVVVGSEDVLTPPGDMRRMAAAIPGSTFVEIPGAGHLANLEDPTAFNDALQSFLEAVRIRT
jgi:pimeloyl-ACP methyl ester carboxylesterase